MKILPIFAVAVGSALLSTAQLPGKVVVHSIHGTPIIKDNNSTLTELIFGRDDSALEILQKARRIITRFDSSHSCTSESTYRLVQACKAVKKDGDASSRSPAVLENVNTLFGIRMALCESAKAETATPRACRVFWPSSHATVNSKSLVRAELDLASDKNVQVCLQDLQGAHFYWTSYSNNRQDASTLCEASRSDIDLRELVQAYRDLTAILPDFLSSVQDQQIMTEEWLREAEARIESLNSMHDRSSSSFVQQHERQSAMIDETFQHVNSKFSGLTSSVVKLEQLANTGLSGIHEVVHKLQAELGALNINLASSFAGASTAVAELATAQVDSVERMSTLAQEAMLYLDTQILKAIKSIEIAQNATAEWQSSARDISDIQAQQLAQAQKQKELSAQNLDDMLKGSTLIQDQLVHFSDLTDSIKIAGLPLELLSEILTILKYDRFWAELAILSIIISSTLFSIWIPASRRFTLLLVFFYVWTQSARVLLYTVDFSSLLHNVKKVTVTNVDAISQHPVTTILIFAIPISIGVIAAILLSHKHHRTTTRFRNIQHASHNIMMGKSMIYSAGARATARRHDRATTAPPGW